MVDESGNSTRYPLFSLVTKKKKGKKKVIMSVEHQIDSEVESCQTCGDTHVTEEACQLCGKTGPFCETCLSHHLKHCQNQEDVSFYEDCSDCEGQEQEEETVSDQEFVVNDDGEDFVENEEPEDGNFEEEEEPDSPP